MIGLIFFVVSLHAQTFSVRHVHFRDEGPGTMLVTQDGITFIEKGKHGAHSRNWQYEGILQLQLSEDRLTVRDYDRHADSFLLPRGFAAAVYPAWHAKLDQRFVAALAPSSPPTLAEFPARMTGLFHGVEGKLYFGEDEIVFRADKAEASRTWRFADIENIASAGPFDLSIVTMEHRGREFRFELQRPMEEARFNELWRKVVGKTLNESSGFSGSYSPSKDTALSYKE